MALLFDCYCAVTISPTRWLYKSIQTDNIINVQSIAHLYAYLITTDDADVIKINYNQIKLSSSSNSLKQNKKMDSL